MMIGQGSSYGHGGSSNLSALAPPFTVDRSVSKPLVDLTEPTPYHSLHSWVSSEPPTSRPDYFSIQNPEFDSIPYNSYSSSTSHLPPSNPHVSTSTDSVFYAQNSATVLEAKPYYPSFVSPATGNDFPLGGAPHHSGYDLLSTSCVASSLGSSHEDHTQNLSGYWSGTWDGLMDWQQREQLQLDGSFCLKDSYTNRGLYPSDSTSKYEVPHSTDTADKQKQTESVGIGQLDCISFIGENSKFVPADYPTPSSLASTLRAPETSPQVPSLKAVSSWNHQMPHSASYEKCLRGYSASSSDTAMVMNSSPSVVIKPPAQDTGSFINVNAQSDGGINDFFCNNPSVVVEPHPFITSKGSVRFDASQVSFHLGKTNQVIAEFSSAKNEELSGNQNDSVDVLDHFDGRKCTIQVPHTSLDCLTLVDKNEAINPVMNYSECLDHYNPAVDSPCWKGAPVSNFSQLEVSEANTPHNVKNLELCASNHKCYQTSAVSSNDDVKTSPKKKSEKSIQHDWSLENHLASSMKRPSVDNVLHGEGIDNIVNSGSDFTSPGFFLEVKISDDSLCNKSFDNSYSKLPHNEQQSCEHGKWATKSSCAPVVSVDDIGMNVINDSDGCQSHVPFRAIEHVLCSPPSTDNASIKLTNGHRGESTQKTYVRALIDTMENLSELLVYHFLNDPCELKGDDSEALKDVISNLELCMLKNVETMTSIRESASLERSTSQLSGRSSKLQKGTNGNGFLASKIDQASLECENVREVHNIASCNNGEKLSNYVSVRPAADILKDDDMIRAIKKALNDNFHAEEESEPQVLFYKNLWLEAEAALCSASCMARFNRMKSEMNKCDLQKFNENSVAEEKLSRSNISSDPYQSNMLASNNIGSPLPDNSAPESSISHSNSHADDFLARYHISECRIDGSISVNNLCVEKMLGSANKLSSSEVFPGPDNVGDVVCEERDGQKPDMSSTTSHSDDVDASVMARLHILKCRVDNLTTVDTKEPQPGSFGVRYADFQRPRPTGTDGSVFRILNVNMEPYSQHDDHGSTEDKLTIKEFHIKDDPLTESRIINRPGDQSNAGFCDGSSDWEHVLLEELAGQSC